MTQPTVKFFGVRHHGPGSARSLRMALERMSPDRVLIEGPPDADQVLSFVNDPEMIPPVALLVYAVDDPSCASFYPFAEFSPEWQAVRYSLKNKVQVNFIDLPQELQMAERIKAKELLAQELLAQKQSAEGQVPDKQIPDEQIADKQIPDGQKTDGQKAETDQPSGSGPNQKLESPNGTVAQADGETDGETDDDQSEDGTKSDSHPHIDNDAEPHQEESDFDRLNRLARADPIGMLGQLSGYADGENWWDQVIESNPGIDDQVFVAVQEAMTALREKLPPEPDARELQREAYMRQMIRDAVKEGAQNIAVVTGAWHTPALVDFDARGAAKADKEILKGLTKTKVACAWVPWTYERLSFESGYGAGIKSPEWYHTLWNNHQQLAVHWLTRVARLLRENDLDASSAHVIESTRLAHTLASMRGLTSPTLDELTEAATAIFCHANQAPMLLIRRRLIVGLRIGEVPETVPQTPVQLDFARLAKRLRLPLAAVEKVYELDLRQSFDLERSQLLHRLNLLKIPWGERQGNISSRGTFKEPWQLIWKPDFAIQLIDASRLGNTIQEAADASLLEAARAATLPELTELLDDGILADLPRGVASLISAIQSRSATTGDVGQLIDCLPGVVRVVRYGDVRKTDTDLIRPVVDGLLTRIMVGLGSAISSLDDEAAEAWITRIDKTAHAVDTLEQKEHADAWAQTLAAISNQSGLHGLVAGRVARMLRDTAAITAEEAAQRLGLALSQGNSPELAAAWLTGFIRGPGAVLVHDTKLLATIDGWILSLSAERFVELLPLVRRAFSEFTGPERSMIATGVKELPTPGSVSENAAGPQTGPISTIDEARAAKVLPILRLILGAAK